MECHDIVLTDLSDWSNDSGIGMWSGYSAEVQIGHDVRIGHEVRTGHDVQIGHEVRTRISEFKRGRD